MGQIITACAVKPGHRTMLEFSDYSTGEAAGRCDTSSGVKRRSVLGSPPVRALHVRAPSRVLEQVLATYSKISLTSRPGRWLSVNPAYTVCCTLGCASAQDSRSAPVAARRITARVSLAAITSVPAMNRVDGPLLTAAGAPTKYSSGIVDFTDPGDDRIPVDRGDSRPQLGREERQPGEVDAEPGPGNHVVDIECGPLGPVHGQPDAAAVRGGLVHTVTSQYLDHSVNAVLEPPGATGAEHRSCLGHPHLFRQQPERLGTVPEGAMPALTKLGDRPPEMPDPADVLGVGDIPAELRAPREHPDIYPCLVQESRCLQRRLAGPMTATRCAR